jgi:rhodanese-related sulfurtransferase
MTATTEPADNLDIDILQQLEPISSLTPDYIQELASQSTREHLDSGVSLFINSDDSSQQAVYLLSGDLELTLSNDEKRLLRGGTDETRHPITREQQRVKSAITTSPSIIVRINRELLDTFMTWGQISAPETEVVMSTDGILTIDKGNWLKLMLKSATFRKLPPANIEELLNRLEPVKVRAGDIIIRQGDPGDFFYMTNEGVALVTRNPDNDEDSIEITELNEGSSFGEAALISDKPRNATVSMMTDGVLLRLSKEDFNKLLTQPTLQWIDYDTANSMIRNGARWIDVRLTTEYQHSHLPDAINIPMQDLHKRARDLDHTQLYICYCQTGRRSSAAAFVLTQYGLKASVLQNGLEHVSSDQMVTDPDSPQP